MKQRNLELEDVVIKLAEEKVKTEELAARLHDADEKVKTAYKTGARDGALRFSRSKTYCKRITGSHEGGWFAAHLYGVHSIGLTQEECEDIELAFLVNKKHKNPTRWETQIILEEIILNADPLTLPPFDLNKEDYLNLELISSGTNQADQPQG